jgi:acyl carrier protein
MTYIECALSAAEKEMDGGKVGYLPVSPMELLRERLISAMEHVQFYRALYEPFGPVPCGDSFIEWFTQLPIINKSQLQADPAALLNPLYNRSELISKPTSGSTGVPFTVLLHNTVSNFRKWRFLRPYQHVAEAPATGLVFIFPWHFLVSTLRTERTLNDNRQTPSAGNERISSLAEASQSFSSAPKKARRTKKTGEGAEEEETPVLNRPFTVNSWLPMEQLFETLNGLNPVSLIGFASNLAALARWMLEEKQQLPSLKQIWTTSEILSPEGADAIRAAMRCEPLSAYASNEFGFMAWEAEPGGPMCFDSDRLYVENIKRNGPERAEIGELSRIVLTDLLNDTMPLIRYDIGDIARALQPIQTTSNLRCVAITDLQGKETDCLQPLDGRTVTTFQILGAIKDHLPNAQYRFMGVTQNRYVLQYRPGARFCPENIEVVTGVLKEILGSEVDIIPQEVGSIEREPSGKLRPLINLCNVSEGKRRELAKQLGILSLLPFTSRESALLVVQKALAAMLPSYDFSGKKLNESQELYADLAINSLRFVGLIVELEKELNREINDEDLLDSDIITVGDLVNFVENLLHV